jgi:hypothetical protein
MKPRFFKVLLTCVVLSQLTMSGIAADSEPAAIVSELRGSATVIEQGKAARALQLYDWIVEGASVAIAKDSTAVLVLTSGARFSLQKDARVVVRRAGLRLSATVRPLPAMPPLPIVPPIASAGSGARKNPTSAGAIRIRGSSIRNLYPSGHATIAHETTLRFDGGVPAFLVVIEDDKGKPVMELHTELRHVVVPPGVLAQGKQYSWRVTVPGDPETLPGEGTFVTLTASTERERRALRSSLAAGGPSDQVLLARIDERLGLLAEARDALAAAAGQMPEDSRARQMLRQIEQQLR